jgi:hypothetical protein
MACEVKYQGQTLSFEDFAEKLHNGLLDEFIAQGVVKNVPTIKSIQDAVQKQGKGKQENQPITAKETGITVFPTERADEAKSNLVIVQSKKYFTLCPGSRISELETFMPIFIEVIKKINLDYSFTFHIPTSESNKNLIYDYFQKSRIDNFIITTNEKDKNFYIQESVLTISKSGTITLDICKNQCPLILTF